MTYAQDDRKGETIEWVGNIEPKIYMRLPWIQTAKALHGMTVELKKTYA